MKVEITEDTLIVRPSEEAATVIPLYLEEGQRAAEMVAWAIKARYPEEANRIFRAVIEVRNATRSQVQ